VICNETTAKVKAYNEMLHARKELEFTIEAANMGTWDLNPVTNKFKGNNRLKSWFGLAPDEEILLDNALAAIIEEDREKVSEAIQKALQKGSDGNYNIVYTIVNKKDGIKRTVRAVGKALFDADGNAYRFSGTLEDITIEYQLQQRKDEFISVASHELKTPLTSLKASMQILQRLAKTDPASDKLPMFIDKASNNLNKLLYLMDDLMNVSKIQHGQLALNKTRIDLIDLINDCCEHVHVASGHQIILNADTELMLYADYRRIDQVVVNLVNNAVKYAPQSNRIEITVEHDDVYAKVSVRDFGIGVRPEKIPHLFDRYYRVDSLGVQFSGLGLGLYISSEIIRRHGGEIGVDSEVGEGSTFWFTLPVHG
jgi:PAS domain S-box-containing protein